MAKTMHAEMAQRENTRGKVSMSGNCNDFDAMMHEEDKLAALPTTEKFIQDVKHAVAYHNAQIDLLREDGKKKLLEEIFPADSSYEMRKQATENFTISWKRKQTKDEANESYLRTEVFDKKTMHAYKINVKDATFDQVVSMWNNSAEVVTELREALRKRQTEARKQAEADKREKKIAAMVAAGLTREMAEAILAI